MNSDFRLQYTHVWPLCTLELPVSIHIASQSLEEQFASPPHSKVIAENVSHIFSARHSEAQKQLIHTTRPINPSDISFSSNAPFQTSVSVSSVAFFNCQLPTHPVASRLSQITQRRGLAQRGTICQPHAWVSNRFTIHYTDRVGRSVSPRVLRPCVRRFSISDLHREDVFVARRFCFLWFGPAARSKWSSPLPGGAVGLAPRFHPELRWQSGWHHAVVQIHFL